MVSKTSKTRSRRAIRRRNAGKANKKLRKKGTPKFPIHPGK